MTQLNALMLARGKDTIIDSQSISVNTDYNLPSSVKKGQGYLILCDVTNNALLTIKSSDGDTVETIRQGYCLVVAKQDSPTDGTHWRVVDVYDEGTWTPTITGQSGAFSSVTYTIQQGSYTRKNKNVFYSFTVVWSAATGGTGNLLVPGIPYTSQASGNDDFAGAGFSSNIDYQVGYTALSSNIPNNVTFVQPVQYGDNVVATLFNVSVATSGSFNKKISGNGHYLKA